MNNHAAASIASRIGYWANGADPAGHTGSAFNGTVFEIMATTTAPTTTILNNLHTAIRTNP